MIIYCTEFTPMPNVKMAKVTFASEMGRCSEPEKQIGAADGLHTWSDLKYFNSMSYSRHGRTHLFAGTITAWAKRSFKKYGLILF